MNIKELSNEELIQLYIDNNYSFQGIEKKYNLSKNSVGRLFKKRSIDYNQIKLNNKQSTIKYCKYCNKELPKNSRNLFCNSSCAASYNNKFRHKNNKCLNCGKDISSKNKFCNNTCQNEYNYKTFIERWLNGEESGISGKYGVSAHIRHYLFEKYNNSCQLCGWNQINQYTNKIPLQIHHLDGNCLNNSLDNLQLLCPNCHSLTNTYGNSNKHSQRVFRKQKLT